MNCIKCRKEVNDGISFCPHCGAYQRVVDSNDFSNNDVMIKETLYNQSENINNEENSVITIQKNKKSGRLDLFICLFVLCLWVVAIYMLFQTTKVDYSFEETSVSENNEDVQIEETENSEGVSKSGYDGVRTADDKTAIIYDNQYFKKMTFNSREDVLKLVASDSVKQKNKCPDEILSIENDIINNYNITAVNLCEMDIEFAKELRNVIAYVYNQFPQARGYLTNLTLANVSSDATYMAAFMPIFTFATSNTGSGYPVGLKTQVILNTKYFLNSSKITSAVKYGSKTGYFPKNANRSSTVAHEMGHYLSYVGMLKYYKANEMTYVPASKSSLMLSVYNDFNAGDFSYKVLQEAYNSYKNDYGSSLSFDKFRENISTYAIAKDESGNYIYDETIAEAFHDYYLNGDNANKASLYVMGALNKYL